MTKTIHLVSILDRSGSMGGTEVEVIGAYNAFIEDQKKLADKEGVKMKATLVLFDDRVEKVYTKKALNDVPELTPDIYFVRGMTAYFDAVGKLISEFDDKKNVMFFIETDGRENASKEYNQASIKTLIDKKTKDGWDFNFVGADLNATQVQSMGAAMGIAASKTISFEKSAQGYSTRNKAFAAATRSYVDNIKDS